MVKSLKDVTEVCAKVNGPKWMRCNIILKLFQGELKRNSPTVHLNIIKECTNTSNNNSSLKISLNAKYLLYVMVTDFLPNGVGVRKFYEKSSNK